jgi:hypothetical protein
VLVLLFSTALLGSGAITCSVMLLLLLLLSGCTAVVPMKYAGLEDHMTVAPPCIVDELPLLLRGLRAPAEGMSNV